MLDAINANKELTNIRVEAHIETFQREYKKQLVLWRGVFLLKYHENIIKEQVEPHPAHRKRLINGPSLISTLDFTLHLRENDKHVS